MTKGVSALIASATMAQNIKVSPDGQKVAFSREVQLEKIYSKDKYNNAPNSSTY